MGAILSFRQIPTKVVKDVLAYNGHKIYITADNPHRKTLQRECEHYYPLCEVVKDMFGTYVSPKMNIAEYNLLTGNY